LGLLQLEFQLLVLADYWLDVFFVPFDRHDFKGKSLNSIIML
jgi:hypothetical protein